jgi:hypothetical protein
MFIETPYPDVPALRQEGHVYRNAYPDVPALRQEGHVYRRQAKRGRTAGAPRDGSINIALLTESGRNWPCVYKHCPPDGGRTQLAMRL